MENELMVKKSTEENREELKKRLISDIERAKSDMEVARANFDFVYKPDDVDIYIYKLRDASSRYEKLIKELKNIS